MATVAQESALLITVPTAETAVAPYRSLFDSSAPLGVPAHVTVLYPFLPPPDLSAEVLQALARLFAAAGRFRFVLSRTGWFGDQVLWLGLEEEAPFRALTESVFAAFPSCPPYGGQFTDVVPHLTIGATGSVSELRAAAEAVRTHLPIDGEATEVTLMTGPPPGPVASPPPGPVASPPPGPVASPPPGPVASPPARPAGGPLWTTVAAFPLG